MNKLVEIPISMIRVPGYQRELSTQRVNSIVKHWDETLMNPVRVSLRNDGFYYIFDGNTTMNSFIKVHPELIRIPGYVYEGLTYEDECRLFKELNTGHKNPNYNELLWASIEGGNSFANQYLSILKESGCKYSFNGKGGKGYGLVCHKAVMNMLRKYGSATIRTSLILLGESNMNEDTKYTNYTVKSVISFLGETKQLDVNFDTVKKTINCLDVDRDIRKVIAQVSANAISGGSSSGNLKYYGYAFCCAYNKHTRTKKIDPSIFLGGA